MTTELNTFELGKILAAPILRDAQNITWFAAGYHNTWLRITKMDGTFDIKAYERFRDGSVEELGLNKFRHRGELPRNHPNYQPTRDLTNNYFALGQLAMVCHDALRTQDWTLYETTLRLLGEHVPYMSDMLTRFQGLPTPQVPQGLPPSSVLGEVLNDLETLPDLQGDPLGHADVDPWYSVQQCIRVIEKTHTHKDQPNPLDEPTLVVLEGATQKSYLFMDPTFGSSGYSVWFDAKMKPLVLDYPLTNEVGFLESESTVWERPRPKPTTVETLAHAYANVASVNNAPLDSLIHGSVRPASPQETMDALVQWANHPEPMALWDEANNPSALMNFGHWVLETWRTMDAPTMNVMDAMLSPVQTAGPMKQWDAWRQLLTLSQKPAPTQELAVDAKTFGELLPP